MENNMTLSEMLTEYKEAEKKMMTIDYSDLSDDDRKTLQNYQETKNLLVKVDNAQRFLAASTIEVSNGESVSLKSLMPFEKYSELAKTVTNNLDKNFINEVCSVNPNGHEIANSRITHISGVNQDEYAMSQKNNTITVLMLQQAINELNREQEKSYQLAKQYEEQQAEEQKALEEQKAEEKDNPDFAEQMNGVMLTLAVAGELYSVSSTLITELEKNGIINSERAKELSDVKEGFMLVESIDGEVMNAPPIEAAESAKEKFYENVDANKAVVHNEAPAKTTSDISKVSGNVKLAANGEKGNMDSPKPKRSDKGIEM